MSYLPDDYEPVEDRIRAFYSDHPQGRITTDVLSLDGDSVTFRASVFRDLDPDPSPAATGHAHGYSPSPRRWSSFETVSIGRPSRIWVTQNRAPAPAVRKCRSSRM